MNELNMNKDTEELFRKTFNIPSHVLINWDKLTVSVTRELNYPKNKNGRELDQDE